MSSIFRAIIAKIAKLRSWFRTTRGQTEGQTHLVPRDVDKVQEDATLAVEPKQLDHEVREPAATVWEPGQPGHEVREPAAIDNKPEPATAAEEPEQLDHEAQNPATTDSEPELATAAEESEQPDHEVQKPATTDSEPELAAVTGEPEQPDHEARKPTTTDSEPEPATAAEEPEQLDHEARKPATTDSEPEPTTAAEEPEQPDHEARKPATTDSEPELAAVTEEPEQLDHEARKPTTIDNEPEPTTAAEEPEQPNHEVREPATIDNELEPATATEEPEQPNHEVREPATTDNEPESTTAAEEPEQPDHEAWEPATADKELGQATVAEEPKQPDHEVQEQAITDDEPEPTTAAEESDRSAAEEDTTHNDSGMQAPRRSTRYHGPRRVQPLEPRVSSVPAGPDNPQPTRGRTQAADIVLRIMFAKGGYCQMGLLPKRPPGYPEEVNASGPNGLINLVALEDDWYQDVYPDDLGKCLRDGIVWVGEEIDEPDQKDDWKWHLSGRDIFVLAPKSSHRGFVMCTRLVLEREHVVACITSQLKAVEQALREAGCEWTKLEADDGVPDGWVVLQGVVPTRPTSSEDETGIMNILRPRPEIRIEFEDGIGLGYNKWLAGYPPSIRVYGDPEHTQHVLIDGKTAKRSDNGSYTVQGWDMADVRHQVLCGDTSREYTLEKCETKWNIWPAYSFAGMKSQQGYIGICGPLTRAFANDDLLDDEQISSDIVQVPRNNPVLLGPIIGEVTDAVPWNSAWNTPCVASPEFEPVWALPALPLTCDKRLNRVLFLGNRTGPSMAHDSNDRRKPDRDAQKRWCRLILYARWKGLKIEPDTPEVAELWDIYKEHALNFKKGS